MKNCEEVSFYVTLFGVLHDLTCCEELCEYSSKSVVVKNCEEVSLFISRFLSSSRFDLL